MFVLTILEKPKENRLNSFKKDNSFMMANYEEARVKLTYTQLNQS